MYIKLAVYNVYCSDCLLIYCVHKLLQNHKKKKKSDKKIYLLAYECVKWNEGILVNYAGASVTPPLSTLFNMPVF